MQTEHTSPSYPPATPFEAAKRMISEGTFDHIQFRGSLKDGHLVLEGLLADQAAIDEIPCGIYVMETDGTLVACNRMAIAAWGRTPELNASEKYCGAHILRYPAGDVMPHEKAPPAVVIRNGGTVRDADVVCEQPSGARLLALVNIFPIRDEHGMVVGAVNCFRHNTAKRVPGLLEEA